jgi:hypothetical protein
MIVLGRPKFSLDSKNNGELVSDKTLHCAPKVCLGVVNWVEIFSCDLIAKLNKDQGAFVMLLTYFNFSAVICTSKVLKMEVSNKTA